MEGPYRWYPTPPQPWDEACPELANGRKHERAYRDGRPFCASCGANPEAPWPKPERLDITNLSDR